ncbi:MAG: RNA polymerase sigma-70 factor [Candidatus Pseudobacter hemicellulosilyticus]|uniref:RNA polymerase sigma-70 factor n=1 Tax=Candidatus Pseudobacter hemicellulosilyticus TaxID=3121375 RepID=A0AAJ5WTH8_9BACT|nr:MAG: RNA polymerase sigma-70 factor [Pseudobacter sp.]
MIVIQYWSKISLIAPKSVKNRFEPGYKDAFTELYRKYYKGLVVWAYNILRDLAAAEDLVHDIFLSLWVKKERLIITTSFEFYLYTALRYQVLTKIRRGKVSESIFENLEKKVWCTATPDNLLYQKELQRRLTEGIDGLPEKARLVYLLSREQQLSHKQIAEQLNISVKTVEFHISIALHPS